MSGRCKVTAIVNGDKVKCQRPQGHSGWHDDSKRGVAFEAPVHNKDRP